MLRIGDVAARTGLSIDALRYYEREGLLGPVERDAGGRRLYDPDSLHLLDVLLCLRRTGMPVRKSREFADLVRSGPATVPDRVEVLRTHRAAVVDRMRQLESDLAVIDEKLINYTGG